MDVYHEPNKQHNSTEVTTSQQNRNVSVTISYITVCNTSLPAAEFSNKLKSELFARAYAEVKVKVKVNVDLYSASS